MFPDTSGKPMPAIEVGAASRDIRQKSTLRLAADFTEKVP